MNVEVFYRQLDSSSWGKKYLTLIREKVPKEATLTEVHHIQPRALGGSNSRTNLVRLTVYQHILAHIYLAKALPCRETLLPLTWICSKSVKHLTDLEKVNLESLPEWTELREKALEKRSKLIHNPETLAKSIKKSQETRTKKYGSCTAYLHTNEIRQKVLDTVAAKYGGDRAGQLHTEEARNRMYNTKLEKYGTTGPVLTEESRRKAIENSKKTRMERYRTLGNAVSLQKPEVRQKAKENSKRTLKKRYGSCTGAMNNPESREKARISRNHTTELRQEIRKTEEFQKWWQEHRDEFKNSWYATGTYLKLQENAKS